MMPHNITRPKILEEQLQKERAEALPLIQEYDNDKFTCDECGARYTCIFVFDPYNTNDDCLAEK